MSEETLRDYVKANDNKNVRLALARCEQAARDLHEALSYLSNVSVGVARFSTVQHVVSEAVVKAEQTHALVDAACKVEQALGDDDA